MEMIAVERDGSVTVKLSATEAKAVRDELAASTSPAYSLSRHIAMVHGEPPAPTFPGRPASELPEWAVAQLSDRGIDDSEVSHFIASRDGRTIAAAVDGKPVHLTRD
jgi:hypothetical protein